MTDIPILLYHSIEENVSTQFRRWAVTPKMFDSHMACLLQEGYVPVPLASIAEAIQNPAKRLPERAVGITFDDGLEDFHSNALPVLSKYGVPATIYIVSGFVGSTSRWLEPEGEGSRRMMTWAQILELAEAGIDIGAHSQRHPHLDILNLDDAYQEILQSKEVLERNLGRAVNSFAYPHGYHSKNLIWLVRLAGYTSACAVKHGLSSTEDNPFALARIIVSRDTTPAALLEMMQGKGLARVPREERLATKVWRIARRASARLRGLELAAPTQKGNDSLYGNPTDHA